MTMACLRIAGAAALDGFRVRLTLTDGSVVERDIDDLLHGPVFESVRRDPAAFRSLRVESGTLVWPGGADLCPDVLVWGGPSPVQGGAPPRMLKLRRGAPSG